MVTKRFLAVDLVPAYVDRDWNRPAKGFSYEWGDARWGQPQAAADGLPAETRFLALTGPHQKGVQVFDSYRPLSDTPALFRTFAALEASESAFRDFANRFGALGVQSLITIPVGKKSMLLQGEPFRRWFREQQALRQIVDLLDAIDGPSLIVLRRQLQSIGNKATRRVLQEADAKRLRAAALAFVVDEVNGHLGARQDTGGIVATRLVSVASGRPALVQFPRSLLATLWLQCAQNVAGDTRFQRCAVCRTWFLVSPQGIGKRKQAIYCSRVCNVRAFRRRDAERRTSKRQEQR